MKTKMSITKDTVTPYLHYLEDVIHENTDKITENATLTLLYLVYNQGKIYGQDEYGDFGLLYNGGAPFHTGALISSAFNPSQRVLTSNKLKSSIDVYWTGMYADYSWWEFREDKNTSHPPEVDYAYFQETGDTTGIPHPDSTQLKARHTGFFTETIADTNIHRRISADIALEYMKFLHKK